MKNSLKIVFICLFFVGCQKEIKPEEIAFINGYWEIEKVVLNTGKEKLYKVNDSFDFFELKANNKGIRKKVSPQLNGTFLVNDTFENISLVYINKAVFIAYATSYAKWKEEIILLTKEKLVLRNDEKSEYHYKKTGPINILNDGKKIK